MLKNTYTTGLYFSSDQEKQSVSDSGVRYKQGNNYSLKSAEIF